MLFVSVLSSCRIYRQQPFQPAKCLISPISAQEILDRLQRIAQWPCKRSAGLAIRALAICKLILEEGKPAPINGDRRLSTFHQRRERSVQGKLHAARHQRRPCHPTLQDGDPLDTSNHGPIAVTKPIMRLYAGILNASIVQYTEGNDLRAPS